MNPYLHFALRLRRESAAAAGADHGSCVSAPLLRRVLGRALVDRFCPFGRPLCESRPAAEERPSPPRALCHLAEICPYGILFAASLTGRPPYALHVSSDGGEDEGSARVEITLFGPAWQLYGWTLASLQQALHRGLGRTRQRWMVEEVHRLRPEGPPERVAGEDLSALPATLRPDLLGVALEPFLTVQKVAVDLLSPARLLRDGRLVGGGETVAFNLLIARILDRFASLYGDGASEILRPEIRSVVEAEAGSVPLLADDSSWVEVRDYSARSGAELLLGGKVGRLVYGGLAGRFLPLLRAGEILHLGKNAASGCGRIRVTLVPEELPAEPDPAGASSSEALAARARARSRPPGASR